MRFEIIYFDANGNSLTSRNQHEFCALELNGNILEYFSTEDACLDAMAACIDLCRNSMEVSECTSNS